MSVLIQRINKRISDDFMKESPGLGAKNPADSQAQLVQMGVDLSWEVLAVGSHRVLTALLLKDAMEVHRGDNSMHLTTGLLKSAQWALEESAMVVEKAVGAQEVDCERTS